MSSRKAEMVICVVFSVVIAGAQTNVQTTNGGTAGTVPVFTSGTNIENSAITQSGGNVGIGTTNPQTRLSLSNGEISIGDPAYSTPYLRIGMDSGFNAYITTNAYWNGSEYDYYSLGAYGSTATRISNTWGNLEFDTASGGTNPISWLPRMFIANAGNVGISTTNPTQPLEVNGNTKVDGTLTVSGSGGLNVVSGGIAFPDGTVQTTAYPASSSGSSAPIQVENNEAVINTGVSANGTGLKHINTNASCSATSNNSQNGNFCYVTVIWPGTPFADINYTATCTPKAVETSPATPWVFTIPDSGKTTTSIQVYFYFAGSDESGTLSGLNCIAIHD